jgi:xylulokinase
MSDYILGVDLGTSSCKAVVVNDKGNIVSSATDHYPTSYPFAGWAEQDPNIWWQAFKSSVRKAIEKSNIEAKDIASVGIDSQGSCLVPIDKSGKSLCPAPIWTDRRSTKQCEWIKREVGEELILKISKNRIDPSNIAPKILWLKENKPEIYKKTWKFLHANGYLIYKLTGIPSMDLSEGCLTQLFNGDKDDWSAILLDKHYIPRRLLPDVYPCHAVVGEISKEAANGTDLKEGTPVIAGGMDCPMSAFGAGVTKEKQTYVTAGTVTAIGVCSKTPIESPLFHCLGHVIPKRWLVVSAVDYGGAGFKWFKDKLITPVASREEDLYRLLVEQTNGIPAGCDGLIFLPYMVGQRSPLWNNNTRGVIFGLSPDHGIGHFVKMLMEGNAYALRNVVELIESKVNYIEELRFVGGCTKVELWNQIFSDIIGKRVLANQQENTALASALLAGVGVGLIKDINEVVKMIKMFKEYIPNLENKELYDDLYRIFKKTFSNLLEVFDSLGNLKNKHKFYRKVN